jgi:hypothetical protein
MKPALKKTNTRSARFLAVVCAAVLIMLIPLHTVWSAGAPTTQLSYQGRLRNKTSGELENGTKSMRFVVRQSNGSASWDSGPLNISVTNGVFNIILDVGLTLGFDNAPYEMEVFVEGESLGAEPILPAPMAINAYQLDGFTYEELISTGDFIVNQYDEAQSPGQFWVAGKSRVGGDFIVDGWLGVGIDPPQARLDISSSGNLATRISNTLDGAGSSGLLVSTARTGADAYILDARSGGLSRLYVRSDGNVGVGTATPSHRLQVDGTTWLDGTLTVNSTANPGLTLGSGSTGFLQVWGCQRQTVSFRQYTFASQSRRYRWGCPICQLRDLSAACRSDSRIVCRKPDRGQSWDQDGSRSSRRDDHLSD